MTIMTEPLTLFSFVSRVARLREAQRAVDMLASDYNRRQCIPLAHEIDVLLIRAQKIRLHPDFLRFVDQVEHMRKAQGEFGTVAEAQRLALESAVDKAIAFHTLDAKTLNARLKEHNISLSVPVAKSARKSQK